MSQFKAATKQVDATCRAISETMLLSVERKRLYVNSEFTNEQAKHRVLVRLPSDHKHTKKLRSIHRGTRMHREASGLV